MKGQRGIIGLPGPRVSDLGIFPFVCLFAAAAAAAVVAVVAVVVVIKRRNDPPIVDKTSKTSASLAQFFKCLN